MTADRTPQQIGDLSLVWGESLRWDDRRQRLYLVDCVQQTLHWLDGAEPPVHTMQLPSLPTGVVLTEDRRLVIALDGGLHLVDPDAGSVELLAAYPEGLGGRANDATADLDGNVITGSLNLVPADGSYWSWSAGCGWRHLDDGVSNANGPVVVSVGAKSRLTFADTHAAAIYAYDYDSGAGTAEGRRLFADTAKDGGLPDGACADADSGIWSCLLNAGKLVRYTDEGASDAIDTIVDLPSDVTFGGPNLDRMFFVSIAVGLEDLAPIPPPAGALMVIDDSGYRGRLEPRAAL